MTTSPEGGSAARPAPLVVAASLGALESLGLLLLAAAEIASLDAERVGLAVSTTVFFALAGVGVGACALGLSRGASWARGPMLLAQLIALGLAWSLRSLPLVALALLAAGVIGLAGLLHPDTQRVLNAGPGEEPDPG